MPPSGFRNIKPMTRDERKALRDKATLERDRLMKRTGAAARMYQANAPGPDGLTCPEPDAAGYLADADRFHSDVAGEELQLRQEKFHREQRGYENRRLANADKEERRWAKIEELKAAEEAYWAEQRELGDKSRKK